MSSIKLYIRNMVCGRCIMVVKLELERLKLKPSLVLLGEADIPATKITEEKKNAINDALSVHGFELIDDKKNRVVEKIKNEIVNLVHYSEKTNLKLSHYLSDKLNKEYNYLSHLFSEAEGTTIEKYFITQKIERVKELLAYGELSLSEIANKLHYSSVSALSSQFKKVTGLTPTAYDGQKDNKRIRLEEL